MGALPAIFAAPCAFQGVKLPELVSSYEWLVDRMSSYGRYDISLHVCERKRESVCVCQRSRQEVWPEGHNC